MTTDNFCFNLQNRPIQTSQTGGQWYSDTSPFSIPWFEVRFPNKETRKKMKKWQKKVLKPKYELQFYLLANLVKKIILKWLNKYDSWLSTFRLIMALKVTSFRWPHDNVPNDTQHNDNQHINKNSIATVLPNAMLSAVFLSLFSVSLCWCRYFLLVLLSVFKLRDIPPFKSAFWGQRDVFTLYCYQIPIQGDELY